MTCETKVLLEFECAGSPARIVRLGKTSPVAMLWHHDLKSWIPMGSGDGDADTGALAVYDALSAQIEQARAERDRALEACRHVVVSGGLQGATLSNAISECRAALSKAGRPA